MTILGTETLQLTAVYNLQPLHPSAVEAPTRKERSRFRCLCVAKRSALRIALSKRTSTLGDCNIYMILPYIVLPHRAASGCRRQQKRPDENLPSRDGCCACTRALKQERQHRECWLTPQRQPTSPSPCARAMTWRMVAARSTLGRKVDASTCREPPTLGRFRLWSDRCAQLRRPRGLNSPVPIIPPAACRRPEAAKRQETKI